MENRDDTGELFALIAHGTPSVRELKSHLAYHLEESDPLDFQSSLAGLYHMTGPGRYEIYNPAVVEAMKQNIMRCSGTDFNNYRWSSVVNSINDLVEDGHVRPKAFSRQLKRIGRGLLAADKLPKAYTALRLAGAGRSAIVRSLHRMESDGDLECIMLEAKENGDSKVYFASSQELRRRKGGPVRPFKGVLSGPVEVITSPLIEGNLYRTPKTVALDENFGPAANHEMGGVGLGRYEYEQVGSQFVHWADVAGGITGRSREEMIKDALRRKNEHLDEKAAELDTLPDKAVILDGNRNKIALTPEFRAQFLSRQRISMATIRGGMNYWLDRMIDVGMVESFRYKGTELIFPSAGTVKSIFNRKGDPEPFAGHFPTDGVILLPGLREYEGLF